MLNPFTDIIASQQDSPVSGDVVKPQGIRNTRYHTMFSRQRDSVEGSVESRLSSGEPDFITAGRPDDPYRAIPPARKSLLPASKVNYGDCPLPFLKGDPIPIRRDTQARDPAGCLIKCGSDGELEPVSPVDFMGDCKPPPVRRPIGGENILDNGAWRVRGEWHLGQRPLDVKPQAGRVEREGHLARC